MTKFQVWKTRASEFNPYFYSLQQHKDVPAVVLNQYQFEGLFPEVGLDAIPEAPETITMTVTSMFDEPCRTP